jgi:DNA-binding NarL/FixJ family response regulator
LIGASQILKIRAFTDFLAGICTVVSRLADGMFLINLTSIISCFCLSVNKLNIFIGEDYPILRSGLKVLLEAQFANVLVHECPLNVSLILDRINKIPFPGLAVLGINNGLAISTNHILEVKRDLPDLRILVLAPSTNMTYAQLFFKHGINGYIGKQSPEKELLRAFHTVLNGNRYLDWDIFGRSLSVKAEKNPFDTLSVPELRVALFLFEGHDYSKIAAMIKINIRTVQLHKHRLYKKLNVKNIIQLVSLGEKHGLLES